MNSHANPSEGRVLSAFQAKKALTIEELSEIQHCAHITSRRRLKQWRALTSYNQNNRYYTLPTIPVFSKEGLWHYRGVSFSKHGTCKQTVVYFVQRSKNGLSNTELSEKIQILYWHTSKKFRVYERKDMGEMSCIFLTLLKNMKYKNETDFPLNLRQ